MPKEFLIGPGRRGVHGAKPSAAGLGRITLIAAPKGVAKGVAYAILGLACPRRNYGRIKPPALFAEYTMAKDPFEQFAIPNEMRSFAEQSVAQARQAFDGFLQAANQAMGQFQGQALAARSGAQEIAQKSMTYAEQNVAATFDFAQKLMRAKDATELMGLQSEYLSRQMQTISAQVQDLGQSAAKMAMEAAKPKT